uniref:Uncharacterized protein n=1 Tax=Chromera velia CCMP2878 TaxID=1169474 RepID=A0A0G4GCX2_9ALVE|mmetsp:Transcript_24321/g.47747  ORF Transcript_24321/g.47747 Transcript_24321/m.47747 type:complete len:294 (-) Transcript_24321:33-914(-)|eukprot:Cvel_4488.t1-p1 / transcript=Cvel_4488.t1 / gene=Cvel_4488 / organism=Chromera_velia_CCMP2878 / gene_product=hypothetical protein / transcript_product=hypothetical protein / location=Cvel_scaffold196:78655-79533(-) / protein_length=293 / sequence_SO=supercontig / SO=protein_coding / is_pseudo=false
MPELPIFQKYFQLLSLVSFFTHYFPSLESLGLRADLPTQQRVSINPSQGFTFSKELPPKPRRSFRRFEVKMSKRDVLRAIDAERVLQTLHNGTDPQLEAIGEKIASALSERIAKGLPRSLFDGQCEIREEVKSFLKRSGKIKELLQDLQGVETSTRELAGSMKELWGKPLSLRHTDGSHLQACESLTQHFCEVAHQLCSDMRFVQVSSLVLQLKSRGRFEKTLQAKCREVSPELLSATRCPVSLASVKKQVEERVEKWVSLLRLIEDPVTHLLDKSGPQDGFWLESVSLSTLE